MESTLQVSLHWFQTDSVMRDERGVGDVNSVIFAADQKWRRTEDTIPRIENMSLETCFRLHLMMHDVQASWCSTSDNIRHQSLTAESSSMLVEEELHVERDIRYLRRYPVQPSNYLASYGDHEGAKTRYCAFFPHSPDLLPVLFRIIRIDSDGATEINSTHVGVLCRPLASIIGAIRP